MKIRPPHDLRFYCSYCGIRREAENGGEYGQLVLDHLACASPLRDDCPVPSCGWQVPGDPETRTVREVATALREHRTAVHFE